MCLKFNESFFSVKSMVNHFVSEYFFDHHNSSFGCPIFLLLIILTSFISSQKSVISNKDVPNDKSWFTVQ